MEAILKRLAELLTAAQEEHGRAFVESFKVRDPACYEIGQAALAVYRADGQACRSHAERALMAEPDDPMPLHYLAIAAVMLGEVQLAESYARRAVQRGGSARSRLFLGNLLLAAGQAAEADEIFCRILARDEANVDAIRGLALARHQQGASVNALYLLTKAYECNPGHASLQQTMLGVLTRMNGASAKAAGEKDRGDEL